MTNIEICQDVVANGYAYIKPVPKDHPDQLNYALHRGDRAKKGFVLLDSYSASAVMAVYNALNDKNKTGVLKLPLKTLIDFAFKNVK